MDAGQFAELGDGDAPVAVRVLQDLQQHPPPVGAVGDFAQVAERFFRRSDPVFASGNRVAQLDQQLAVAFALEGREDHDAGQVVVGAVLLGEVPNNVRALLVHLAQHVEAEVLHLVVQGFVVQEEFGQQAEALAVELSTNSSTCSV